MDRREGKQGARRRASGPARAVALVAASLVAGLATVAPASAQADVASKSFKPVETARHALVFAPRSVRSDAIQAAKVRLRNRRTGASSVRSVSIARVRRALERGSRLRIRKAPGARGRLIIYVARRARIPSGAIPSVWRRSASFETLLNGEIDLGWNVPSPFNVTRTSEAGASDGSYAAKIVTNGGSSGCSCPRMKFEDGFSYGPGSDVWISGSWRIPEPRKVAWSRLMNLGHWTGDGHASNWHLALESTNAGTMQVSYSDYGDPKHIVLPARPIPADRWFRVDLHFKLSPTDGRALTEWYIDGELVGSTTKANMMSSAPLHFFNAGLPYFWSGNGNTTVYFDAARLTP